jgi:hypothetical protein
MATTQERGDQLDQVWATSLERFDRTRQELHLLISEAKRRVDTVKVRGFLGGAGTRRLAISP